MHIDEPVPTVDTSNRYAVVQPFIRSIGQTSAKYRFGLIVPGEIDIGFRMLQPHELAAATGFPKGYKFAGNKSEVVKQIGNAVPPGFANALLSAYLEESA